MLKRGSGILLPIFSLPSPYGVGTLGKAAYEFADFLAAAGQSYWQILPLGPTGFGDSPYQSFSSFAGNPYFIDLDMLIEKGLLTREEVENTNFGTNPRYVDYGKLYGSRMPLLWTAAQRGAARCEDAFRIFKRENAAWLDDYSLFMALKKHFDMAYWLEWPDEGARRHRANSLAHYRTLLAEDIDCYSYLQFLFYNQWDSLKSYCNEKGIRIIGDVPIYVAPDSADVWAEPGQFLLNGDGRPSAVAGVPPDYFSADGQLWGNPLYDYAAMERDGWSWWIRRIGGAQRLYDAIRIDHFRGFSDFWSVPVGAKTAAEGHWVKGPGLKLVKVLTDWFYGQDFIAEDLGAPTTALTALLRDSGLPGMKVLEFAFDNEDFTDYQPHAYGENCVCYTGTHDNSPLLSWEEECEKETLNRAKNYFKVCGNSTLAEAMLRGGMGSRAVLFIAQMQDYLGLGRYNRINTPGTDKGNWEWRLLPEEVDSSLAVKLYSLTKESDRI